LMMKFQGGAMGKYVYFRYFNVPGPGTQTAEG
jgi:hypothetical protein